MDKNAANVILFDGVCNLCNGFVQFLIKQDSKGSFKFASLQSQSAQDLLLTENMSADRFDSVVYISGGEVWQKSAAVLRILNDVGGLWKMFYVLIIIPRIISDAVYDFVATNRYRMFGKRQECMVPTDELRSRFLED
ncbi:thiol-disulfide oxidoreductase DCC family protein [Salibacteraceae bacterium]|nr:thiol-disulfide oxidoreductase DCC family protein [Salibacteraceae bacterium]